MLKIIVKKALEPFVNILNRKYLKKYYSEMNCYLKDINNFDDGISMLKNILIISPHQDDESIGMGGTIKKLVDCNTNIDLIYLTDGRLEEDNYEISNIRINEAIKVVDLYGIEDFTYFNFVNKTIENHVDELVQLIKSRFSLNRYDAVFFPSPYECNNDHAYVYDIILELINEGFFREDVEIYLYDINNSIQGSDLNCISLLNYSEATTKWDAYKVFKSQIYITFSTIRLMDQEKLNLIIDIYKNKYAALEIFCKMNLTSFIEKSKNERFFRKNMKTTTSCVKLIRNMNINKEYRNLIK